ncbi:hypothetical protein SBOR_9873 [Sclerotinia borealis F-4128]|uniref:Uncharacterized protein n=1 Tax=Sclerotinia borealis (strain F-4128) TaxID=1432307 RepID=W9C1H0_SCLBF|nr:hypothetical protein SBOR_9873 [Sclerotinia borealis F-4128]
MSLLASLLPSSSPSVEGKIIKKDLNHIHDDAAYFWLYMNLEDLVRKVQIIYCYSWARELDNSPHEFALVDLWGVELGYFALLTDMTRSGEVIGKYLVAMHCMLITNCTGGEYGSMASVVDEPTAVISGRAVDTHEGLLFLITHQHTLELLIKCCGAYSPSQRSGRKLHGGSGPEADTFTEFLKKIFLLRDFLMLMSTFLRVAVKCTLASSPALPSISFYNSEGRLEYRHPRGSDQLMDLLLEVAGWYITLRSYAELVMKRCGYQIQIEALDRLLMRDLTQRNRLSIRVKRIVDEIGPVSMIMNKFIEIWDMPSAISSLDSFKLVYPLKKFDCDEDKYTNYVDEAVLKEHGVTLFQMVDTWFERDRYLADLHRTSEWIGDLVPSQVSPIVEDVDKYTIPELPKFELKLNLFKVFKALLSMPKPRQQQGVIAWTDFLATIVEMGFEIQKRRGSSWQFKPTDKIPVVLPEMQRTGAKQAGRHIIFHDPHPSLKIRFEIVRIMGRRLARAYGWTGEMFEMELLAYWCRSRQQRRTEKTELDDTTIVVQPVVWKGKSKVIGGQTYYANDKNEIVIRISDEEGPTDVNDSNKGPTMWNMQKRGYCCVCLKKGKVLHCEFRQICGRGFDEACANAVGCVYYESNSRLECPVHYQGWVEDGIRFKYELADSMSCMTDFDKVVAEVRGLLAEEDWDTRHMAIIAELQKCASDTAQLLGKHKQLMSDRQFLLLIKKLVIEVLGIVSSTDP